MAPVVQKGDNTIHWMAQLVSHAGYLLSDG